MSTVMQSETLVTSQADPTKPAKPVDLTRYREDAKQFHRLFKTVILGTVSPGGDPQASYAVCVPDGTGYFYTYLSELSPHTLNLMTTGKASLLFIEDESVAKHPFARRRLTWSAEVCEVPRGESEFDRVMDLFEEHHGPFMRNLRELADFHLFQLAPGQGSFVAGFAKAFSFDGPDFKGFSHMNDKGHKKIDKQDA